MLESLGYVWSRPPSKPDGTPTRDPREALESMRRMADADRLVLAGETDRAIEAYRDVIHVEPASIDARVRLAQLLIAQGRAAEAVEPLKTAVAVNPHEPFLHRKLANTLESLRRFDEALAVYDAGLALHPEDRDLRNERWRCMNSMGLQARILDEAERAIATDPDDGAARYVRAIACCGADIDGYLAALEREWAELPGNPILAAALDQARREAAATQRGRH